MPNRNYQKGTQFERDVCHFLSRQGWLGIRAAGSHGVIDIMASLLYETQFEFTTPFRGRLVLICPKVLAIQCKTRGVISVEDKARLVVVAKGVGAVPVLAYRGKKGIEKGRIVLREVV